MGASYELMPKSAEECLNGSFLYGDDFSAEMTELWFREEQEAYLQMAMAEGSYEYSYHALHREHGYRNLPDKFFHKVLGFGSARGDELDGILDRCGEITIVEPADGFRNPRAHYEKPRADGACLSPMDLSISLRALAFCTISAT